jgi:heat shock protein HtpX
MRRIVLFLVTNLAILLTISLTASILGVDRWASAGGIQYGSLLALSVIIGFTGSIFSLLLSKPMAKWSTGAQVVSGSEGGDARWLVQTVHALADRAGIGHPEVAIYEGAPNAFATGAFKNSALVAVSTGLLQTMRREEVEAVLGHEVAHIANGDMVTLTLIQGVVNTFVVFLSRLLGFVLDNALSRGERDRGPGMGYFLGRFVFELLFGILASIIVAWFSRRREFRADAGAAELLGSPQPMIAALRRLGGLEAGDLPQSIAASGISSRSGFFALFSSHPPIEERIAALQR